MGSQISLTVEAFGTVGRQEKFEQLRNLSDFVWNIGKELAQVKIVQASLMTSLQRDLRQQAS